MISYHMISDRMANSFEQPLERLRTALRQGQAQGKARGEVSKLLEGLETTFYFYFSPHNLYDLMIY